MVRDRTQTYMIMIRQLSQEAFSHLHRHFPDFLQFLSPPSLEDNCSFLLKRRNSKILSMATLTVTKMLSSAISFHHFFFVISLKNISYFAFGNIGVVAGFPGKSACVSCPCRL